MDTEKQDGASSSQNANSIVEIEAVGAVAEIAKISLTDGSSFFVPIAAIASECLRPGLSLLDAEIARLSKLGEVARAEAKALGLLAIREHSRFQLAAKLKKRGFPSATVDAALDRLCREGHLDDLRFASLWIDSRMRRNPEGRPRLMAGLRAAGVGRECADEALRAISDEMEEAAMREAALRLLKRPQKDADHLCRALIRKGFAFRSARRLADELCSGPSFDAE